MKTMLYKIHLLSDAQLGSGFGNEVINNVLARDHDGNPVLRGTHLKGLLRDQLKSMGMDRDWPDSLHELCFGRESRDGDAGGTGLIRVSDARPEDGVGTRSVSRTRLEALGVAESGALRTAEAVQATAIFNGRLRISGSAPDVVEKAVRLALLSLEAIGGSRQRGAGACRVDLDEGEQSITRLLTELERDLAEGLDGPGDLTASEPADPEPETPPVLLRLLFRADDPVCCPDAPVTSNNVIRSGLGIPASAVLGAVISRLAEENAAMAHAVLKDARTRSWPLLPCGLAGDEGPFPTSVRVSLSHRMSKLPDEARQYRFEDAAMAPYNWREAAANSPLKGADGVLLCRAGEPIRLWRSGDMPRLVTAHAVHHGGRNLFTVEAQGPMIYAGWISLPPAAATRLMEQLHRDDQVVLGKARTVRGGGRLCAEPMDPAEAFSGTKSGVYVLQSPAAIPDNWDIRDKSVRQILSDLVSDSGWGPLVREERATSV
ncbi:MAG: RAMP superfamily CRISPR-associated protein, partial [Verrucomicrobiota bacterium]